MSGIRQRLAASTVAVLACLMAAVGVGSLGHAAPADTQDQFRRLLITANGLTLRATDQSTCVPNSPFPGSGFVCEDVAFQPRPTRGRLPLTTGRAVLLRFGAEARSVRFELERVSKGLPRPVASGSARRSRSSLRRWHVRLPPRLRRFRQPSLITISVRFRNGSSADFSASVRDTRGC